MILRRLYELADWANLLTDASVIQTPIACVVKVGRKGDYNGLTDLREDKTIPGKGKKGIPKTVKTAGMQAHVPIRPVVWDIKAQRWKTTDPAASGLEKPAVFLADTLARVLPIEGLIADKDREKFQAQRSTCAISALISAWRRHDCRTRWSGSPSSRSPRFRSTPFRSGR